MPTSGSSVIRYSYFKKYSSLSDITVNIDAEVSFFFSMDHVRQNEIQGRNMVFFEAHAYSISFCLT